MAKKLNPETDQQNIYTFLDYEVDPNLREIHQVKTPLNISKKSFDILLLLIEKQGCVVTKQELIDHVWPNQIVTDAALNKQITRLRSDLVGNKSSQQPIIETVRGVGIKLTPVVQVKPSKIQNKKKSKAVLWLASIFLVLAVYLAIDFFNHPLHPLETQKAMTLADSKPPKPVRIVLMPAEKLADWLNVGGLNYLSEQLQKHPQIQTINPNTEWFKEDQIQTITIEMSQKEHVDYVLSVKSLKKDQQYMANIVLRKHAGVVAKGNIKAASITGLFERIDGWVSNQISINSAIVIGEIDSYKTTDFVLESYLRGRQTAIHKSYEKASQLYQTALNQDESFLPALTALADTEAHLGKNEKALALVNTAMSRNDFNSSLTNKMLLLKAKFLTNMNKLAEAQVLLEKAISLSEENQDFTTLIDAITIQIQANFKKGKINKDTIALVEKQISLLREHNPDTYILAIVHFNLATSHHQLGNIEDAIKAINISSELYTADNNIRGMVTSASLLARIYKDMGDTGSALTILDSIEGLFEKIDGIDEQQIYLQYKIENLIYHGLRKKALATIKKLEKLNQQSSSLETKIVALSLRFELNQIHKDYFQAKNNVKQMLAILSTEKQDYPPIFKDLILAYDMFISCLTDEPNLARKTVAENLKTNPNIKSFFKNELRMINAIILTIENKTIQAVEIYRSLIKDYIKLNQLQDAFYYAGYPLLDILWETDKQEYVKTMNYLDELAIFKYPIHKYKAQYLAYKKEYTSAYVMMVDLKSKANEFWTTEDQILLEEYQQLAKQL